MLLAFKRSEYLEQKNMAENIAKKTQKNAQKKIETYFARAPKSTKIKSEDDNIALNEPEKFYLECLQNQSSEIPEVENQSIESAESDVECVPSGGGKAHSYVNEEDVIIFFFKLFHDHSRLEFDSILQFHFI